MGEHRATSPIARAVSMARFQGVFPVVLALGVCLLAINLSLLWLTGPAPRYFVLPQVYLDWQYFNAAADTVAGLVTAYGHGAANKPFLLYAGLSTAVEGIDPRILQANDGCDAPVVGICGTGGSMQEMLALQAAFLRSNLRASVAVLCIHPAWLAGMFSEPPPDSLNPIDPLRQGDWREAANRMRWWIWLVQNRFYANQVAFKFLYNMRLNLGTVAHVDPWREPQPLGFAAHQTLAQLQAQMAYLVRLGWFNAARYAHEQDTQAAALNQLISQLRSRGVRVLVVLMPETSIFRANEPAGPKQFLLDDLGRAFQSSDPPVFDFQNAIPDDLFSDLIHMNAGGRTEFSHKLAQAIKNRKPQ